MILTFRYRLKETSGAARELTRQARAVSFVWNFCGETQETARRWTRLSPSGIDLINLTHGTSRDLGLHSDTVQAVCKQFAHSRDTHHRRPRWRGRFSLGWIPFQAARAIRLEGGAVIFLKRRYRLWMSRAVEGMIKSGCFAQDARRRWYLNLQVELAERVDCGSGAVAIDLGVKNLATLSTGEKVTNPRPLARYAEKLASAQRAGRKARARAIHAKILQLPEALPASAVHAAGAGKPPHLRRQRERQQTRQNQHGEVGARCRLVAASIPAPLQGHQARGRVHRG